MRTELSQRVLALSLEYSGLDLIDNIISEISKETKGSFCFLGFLKDIHEETVLGCLAHEGEVFKAPFEYCMKDQPCRLIYDDHILKIPCDVQKNFERKKGTGLESFMGFPLPHPSAGIIGHIAAYHSDPEVFEQISAGTIGLIQSILSREVVALLKDFEQSSYEDIKKELNIWRDAALLDKLTGIKNRRALEEAWHAEMKTIEDTPFSLAILDIDHFKHINDTYGHDVGDECLKEFSNFLQGIENSNTARFFRLGGEEFCVFGIGLGRADLKNIVSDWHQKFALFQQKKGNTPSFTFSGGIADAETTNFSLMLKSADDHLYAAKSGGRNQID